MASTEPTERQSDSGPRRPPNRRDLILDAAVKLFHERGYPATSVDDIGKAVDISGPAIYRHFSSKEEILVDAIRMAADEVHHINDQAREQHHEPRGLLGAYIRAYVGVALDRSGLIAVWNSEARHLSHERRSPMTRRLRSWSAEWVEALTEARPELDEATARLLVAASIGLITSVATASELDIPRTHLADNIVKMALATLDTPLP